MIDRNLFTLADLRAALGFNEKVMLSDLLAEAQKLRRDAERYRKVRELTLAQLSGLKAKAFARGRGSMRLWTR